jgi:hypothetical protein
MLDPEQHSRIPVLPQIGDGVVDLIDRPAVEPLDIVADRDAGLRRFAAGAQTRDDQPGPRRRGILHRQSRQQRDRIVPQVEERAPTRGKGEDRRSQHEQAQAEPQPA